MTYQRTSFSPSRSFSTPRARTCAQERNVDYKTITGSGPDGLIIERDILHAAAVPAPFITPLAKKLAALQHIDPSSVPGTGFHGKIMAGDIKNACSVSQAAPKAFEQAVPKAPATMPVPDNGMAISCRGEVPFTGMRKLIADKMLDSLLTLAQANHRMTADMSEAIRIREQLKAFDIKVSYNDIVVRCVAKALSEHPIMNASMGETSILLKSDINVGIAVATDNGLLVPVIKHTDQKSLQEIAFESRDLSARTKAGLLLPDEMSEGTFTVTNLGMYGIESFTAIINKPEAGILAVGRMEKKPVVIDDEITIRPLIELSLTYDHRIVDGAPAAVFLRRIQQLLENPGLLI